MNALKRIPRTRLVATGAGLIVLALSAAWFLWPEPGPDDHRTNPDALSMAISQAELDEIAELHTHMDGEPVTDALGTAHGALLVLDNGVVALSGEQWADQRDGHWPEQWRYLDHDPVTDVEVLPVDNANESIALTQGQIGEEDHSVTLLDSHTGEIEGGARLGNTFSTGDELHLNSAAVLQQSGHMLSSYALGHIEEPLGRSTWALSTDELCPEPSEPSGSADITPAPRSFIISLRCNAPETGKESQVVSHQDSWSASEGTSGGTDELWRMVWEDVDPDAEPTQVGFMSPAVVPDSPEDVVTELMKSGNSVPYALAHARMNAEADYHHPPLFQGHNTQEYFSEPLLNRDEYPEVLIVGGISDLHPHMSMQGAKLLLSDPDVDFSRADSPFLQWDSGGAEAEPQSYRAYETPELTLDLEPQIEDALS
ncbi:hypothetical protein IDM40_19855 [Nocardiopsis sp. HNM0947]|uniref:Secreted protein n=1 Tax=Nocardiopsis coralli TaxID=2772213 RepID=A0ABR9PAS3_9ACTN|nr:hypothetical protein [Nocardiopsis coralli]MBE3000929.1 hypothetical protein [Nocardiopsis coralli]